MLGDITSSSESDIEYKDEKVSENYKEFEASNSTTPATTRTPNSNEALAVAHVTVIV